MMAAKRFKRLDDFTTDEQVEYLRNGTIPELSDPEEDEALREAGFDPETRRPLAEVEAEAAEREAREDQVREYEDMSVDDHAARQEQPWVDR